MENEYTYAVARVRALEISLISNADVEKLIACQNAEQCMQLLAEKGWNGDTKNAEDMLRCEEERIWKTVKELSVDMEKFDVLSYSKLFHNLKAAIKASLTNVKVPHIFYDDVSIPGSEMLEIINEKKFDRLPANMQAAAKEAFDVFLKTKDGQLCDIIIDKAALDAIYAKGEEANEDIIKQYAESIVAVADIKIAVRGQKTSKSAEFMRRAMADCASVSADKLISAALVGIDAICDYLSGTEYADGAQALATSPYAFERWCDNRIIKAISPQKYESFTIGPVIAYVIARQNEIKTVRNILSGKQNGLSEDSIRERVREMYV